MRRLARSLGVAVPVTALAVMLVGASEVRPATAATTSGQTRGDDRRQQYNDYYDYYEDDEAGADFAPAAVDAPAIRNLEPRTRVYVDGSVARTTDLSALPYVGGQGRNLRLGAGATLKLGRFQLEIELPASQRTTIDVTMVPPSGLPPLYPEDAHQTATSIGDLRLGAQWSARLPIESMSVTVGLALRGRFPTHTTGFQFNLIDGSLGIYRVPYYFHVEPALLFGARLSGLSFTMNQGLLALLGPDGEFQGFPIVVPSIYFWDAHYAVAFRVARPLALSVEANTVAQLNRVTPMEFERLNDIYAVFVQPAIQLLLGPWRIDLVGRLGVNRGAELIGVMGFGGTQSFTLRLGRIFY